MKLQTLKRSLAALGVILSAGATSLVAASPAAATPGDCRAFVAYSGYDVGPKVTAACNYEAFYQPFGDDRLPHPACTSGLKNIGVTGTVAHNACKRS